MAKINGEEIVNISTNSEITPSFLLQVAMGKVEGASIVNKFGQNSAVGSTYEDIWDGGGTYSYPDDATAPITHMVSTANDLIEIQVQGLDIDGVLQVQNVVLTGITPVALPTPLWRVFRIKNCCTADAIGDVSATNAGETTTWAIMQVGNNQTLMALYTIPAGHTGFMIHNGASLVGTNKDYAIDGRFYFRPFGSVHQLKTTFGMNSNGNSAYDRTYELPVVIAEKSDIRVSCSADGATGEVNATFDILLLDNTIWEL